MSTFPLFPVDANDIRQRLCADFHSWLASRAQQHANDRTNRELKEGSAKVYREMWFAFADYCAIHSLCLETLSQKDIVAFLELRARGEGNARMLPKGASLSPRYAWRMLTLIERITCFVAEREQKGPNRAARDLLELPAYRYANARQKDPLPEYYSEPQVQQIILHLSALSEAADALPSHWKEIRDHTAVGLMLGAGLTPGDVRAIRIDGVFVAGGKVPGLPWKLALPGNGNSPARETPIAEWAARLLAQWMKVRAAQGVPGAVLFPSTLSGKPLSHAACYKVCKAVLQDAGMDDEAGGIFKLRHTFALRQLADGKSETEVARWLGLLDLNGMNRYRRIVKKPVDLM